MMPPTEDNPLFQRNMAFLRVAFPEIADTVAKFPYDPARLPLVGEDDWDLVTDDGALLYHGHGSRKYARAHVDAFWGVAANQRMRYPPPENLDADTHADTFQGTCIEKAHRAGIEFSAERLETGAANVVVFGVGLGHHLPHLVEKSGCESVIVIEPNFQYFFYSLCVFDWRGFIEGVRAGKGDVGFLLTSIPEQVGLGIMGWLNNRYPSLADGTLFYRHYASDLLEEMDRAFGETYLSQTGMGLGFVEDELVMIENTIRNLEHFEGHIFRRGADVTTMPAFIVGSGPSFDTLIGTVSEFAGRVVVISCGTTLRMLLGHGIVPDIHVELENVPAAYDNLAACAREHDFRRTLLVASSTIDPRIPALFDDVAFFFREGPAAFPMFSTGMDCTVKNAHPMVSNLALSLAREIGCREIYLMGIDLGTKDKDRHHGKDSPYNTGDLEYGFKNIFEHDGNFGGTVFANFVYVQSRMIKEAEIAANGGQVTYFNCSDGARIDGARPLHHSDVRIEAADRNKENLREQLLDRFVPYDRATFDKHWTGPDHVADLDTFRDALFAPSAWAEDGYGAIMALLRHLTRTVAAPIGRSRNTEELLFRGTLSLAMRSAHFFLTRIAGEPERDQFASIVKEELRALIGRLHERVLEKYAGLGLIARP